MIINKIKLVCLILFFPLGLSAQVESVFNDIKMEESLEDVSQKLHAISESSNLVTVEKPTFPLSKNKEDHLICSNIKTDHGNIDKAVFTFADNQLKYIIAKGNVFPVFAEKRTDTSLVYMDYEVFFSDKLFLNKKKDLAWILTDESVHPNLFAWVNPYLDPNYKPEDHPRASNHIPPFLKMGGLIDELSPVFEKNSDFTFTEELDGSDPNAQIQINCFGVDYLGFPRKVEARFGDNKLNVVWILTAKGEEERVREALIKQYGQPVFVNEDWEIFNDWQVGLRKDKPEVLLMEKKIGKEYKTSYFKQ